MRYYYYFYYLLLPSVTEAKRKQIGGKRCRRRDHSELKKINVCCFFSNSETRRLDYFFDIWPFRYNNEILAQQHQKFAKVGFSFAKYFKTLPKWRKFRRIWSHCSQTKGVVVCIVVAIPLIRCVAAFLPEKKGTQQSICKDLETYIPRYRLLFYLPAQQRLAGKGFYTARLKGYKFLIISRQATKEFLGNLG